nr:PREDICTED: transcription factor 23 isoform X2 [Latimeria chalumnae]|eukprot:XP_014345543.1 PREDICTED: transcription factor 23 isoform X2 [Latimeria chalumnae]
MAKSLFGAEDKLKLASSCESVRDPESLPKEGLYHPERVGEETSSSSQLIAIAERKVEIELGPPKKVGKPKHCPENAARERSRVQTLRRAFLALQAALPSVPPDTKLSKLDVLILATSYIAHLTRTLDQEGAPLDWAQPPLQLQGYLHPMKKWPMRSQLYSGTAGDFLHGGAAIGNERWEHQRSNAGKPGEIS